MRFFRRRGSFGASDRTVLSFLVSCWKLMLFPFRYVRKATTLARMRAADWWKGRRFRNLLFGIPAFALALVCGWFLAGRTAASSFALSATYLRAGNAAFAAQNWPSAKLYLERAVQLGVKDREVIFRLAQTAESTQDVPRKIAILEQLAPDDGPGYAPAYFWRATQILRAGSVDRNEVQVAENCLKQVLAQDPDHTAANGMLGDIYFQMGLWRSAIRHLELSSPQAPKYRLLLAKACLFTGDQVRAERFGREAQLRAQEQYEADPANVEDCLLLADATTLLEQFDDAIGLLTGMMKYSNDPALKLAATRVYIHWSDSIEGRSAAELNQRLALLATGLRYNPQDTDLFDRLMKVLSDGGDGAESAAKFLRENIAQKNAVGICHLILGTFALSGGEAAQAGVHLERAFAEMPDAPVIANNFAWYLAHKQPPELDRALRMIGPIAEKYPENHHIRDTRGQIYLRLEKWRDAVNDLEFAVQGLRTDKNTHIGLANAYRNLGLASLADEYQKMAETLGR